MQINETSAVLAKIQAYSNRNVDKAVILAWHEILEPYALKDCLNAVADHYRHSKEWLMPADIVARVKEYRQERIDKFRDGIHLSPADERRLLEAGDMAHWRDTNRRLRTAAADGELTPEAYEAYQDGRLQLDNITRKEITN